LFNKNIKIQNKVISQTSPTFVIAEAGVNHGGDMVIAKKLIDLAIEAKADAVKFQTFKADHLILKNIQKAPYQKNTTDSFETQHAMLKRLEVSKDQNIELNKYCLKNGIIFLTTPFDEESLKDLDDIELPAYKVASSDLTNIPFLIKIAKKRKPIILSSGMSYLHEVKIALDAIYEHNKDVILLQCTANYPIKNIEANLAVLDTYKNNFDILLGYSDHSVGTGAAPFAIPMGAKILEKHFTLNKSLDGPDHEASLSPKELIDFLKIIRRVDEYMGSPIKKPTTSEEGTRRSLQKCLVAKVEIKKGDLFTENNLVAKRTGGVGISPINMDKILFKSAKINYKENQVIEK
jgi:sialic acid synthase SpsE